LHNNHIKLTDLGLAKYIFNYCVIIGGTPIYKSPEMIKYQTNENIKITFKTDVWSIGIVIYELLTLKRPFQNEYEIQNTKMPDLDYLDLSDFFKILISKFKLFLIFYNLKLLPIIIIK